MPTIETILPNDFVRLWNKAKLDKKIKFLDKNFRYFYSTKQTDSLKELLFELVQGLETLLLNRKSDNETANYLDKVIRIALKDIESLRDNLENKSTTTDQLYSQYLSIKEELLECSPVNTKESYDYIATWKTYRIDQLISKITKNFAAFYGGEQLLIHLELLDAKIVEFINGSRNAINSDENKNKYKYVDLLDLIAFLDAIRSKIATLINNLSVLELKGSQQSFDIITKELSICSPVTKPGSNYLELFAQHGYIFSLFLDFLDKNALKNLFYTSKNIMQQMFSAYALSPPVVNENNEKKLEKNMQIKDFVWKKYFIDFIESRTQKSLSLLSENLNDTTKAMQFTFVYPRNINKALLSQYMRHLKDYMEYIRNNLDLESSPYLLAKKLMNQINSQPNGDYYPNVWYKGIYKSKKKLALFIVLCVAGTLASVYFTRKALEQPNKTVLDSIVCLFLYIIVIAAIIAAAGGGIACLMTLIDCNGDKIDYQDHPVKFMLPEHNNLLEQLKTHENFTYKNELAQITKIENLYQFLEKNLNNFKVEQLCDELQSLEKEMQDFVKTKIEPKSNALEAWKNYKAKEIQLIEKYHAVNDKFRIWKPPVKPRDRVIVEVKAIQPNENTPLLEQPAKQGSEITLKKY
jgi:hypothetical protein